MKYLLVLITFIAISCNAQIVSLETIAQCSQENPPFPCPDNWTYEKDINNSLDKYIGIWKGTHDGKIYEIQFKKGLYQDLSLSNRQSDILIGRLRIKTTGNLPIIIFDNFDEPDDKQTHFAGLGFQKDLNYYMMGFYGPFTKGCINSGNLYIGVKPNQPNQMEILYLSDMDLVTGVCPPTFKTTIPEKQNIYLTKQ
ncbi:DUF6705 family protein [Chryseobacterium taihuense]|uniref:DUF6705 domain-containing protein n=1 Tax=Chryseobacterium taihuense TaxID=1141221 RepID=A0ABY0QS78_9FLAO|nr:DUF6705 family protein [Chryseobacterium taihuense]SDL68193.1 hypothetical protein SAMN05216273_104164 [Chryseobacterium taihuense]